MNRRNQSMPERKRARPPQGDPKRWRTYTLMIVCGLTLVSGFFFAGRQHFSSMDYGMKNSRLRKQVDELEAEKRRLLLTREVALSPAEIKKAAKKTGLIDPSANDGSVAQVASTTKEKAVPTTAAQIKPMIIKTAAVSAVRPTNAVAYTKTTKVVKQARTTLSTE